MSRTREMKKEKDIHERGSAGVLAEFATLDPSAVEKFRKDYPDFVPSKWWDYQPDNEWEKRRQWEITQECICNAWTDWGKAWEEDIDADLVELSKLLMLVFDPDIFDILGNTNRRPTFANFKEIDGQSGYHKAVAFMAKQPWRAKVCEQCHRRFVADHAKRQYCSVECSAAVIKRTGLEWGRKNNWGRPKKTKAKRKRVRLHL